MSLTFTLNQASLCLEHQSGDPTKNLIFTFLLLLFSDFCSCDTLQSYTETMFLCDRCRVEPVPDSYRFCTACYAVRFQDAMRSQRQALDRGAQLAQTQLNQTQVTDRMLRPEYNQASYGYAPADPQHRTEYDIENQQQRQHVDHRTVRIVDNDVTYHRAPVPQGRALTETNSRHTSTHFFNGKDLWYHVVDFPRVNLHIADMLYDKDSLKPLPLREKWRWIDLDDYEFHKEKLDSTRKMFQEVVKDLLELPRDFIKHPNRLDRLDDLRNKRDWICGWSRELDYLNEESRRPRRVGREPPPRELTPPLSEREPRWETGIHGEDFNLKDVRQKRFINCGVICPRCTDTEEDAEHPLFACGTMFEIFTHYVGPRLKNRKQWCHVCRQEGRYEISKYHRTDQCELGMWCDHPDNESVEMPAAFKKWYHPYPDDVLGFKPGPVS